MTGEKKAEEQAQAPREEVEEFVAWFWELQPRLQGILAKKLQPNHVDAAEDIWQDVSLRLLQNFRNKNGMYEQYQRWLADHTDKRAEAYVRRAITHACTDRFRRDQKPTAAPLGEPPTTTPDITGIEQDIALIKKLEYLLVKCCQQPEMLEIMLTQSDDEDFLYWYLLHVAHLKGTSLQRWLEMTQLKRNTVDTRAKNFIQTHHRIVNILSLLNREQTTQVLASLGRQSELLTAQKKQWAAEIGEFLQSSTGQPLLYYLLGRQANKKERIIPWKPKNRLPFQRNVGTLFWLIVNTARAADWEELSELTKLSIDFLQQISEKAYPGIFIDYLAYHESVEGGSPQTSIAKSTEHPS